MTHSNPTRILLVSTDSILWHRLVQGLPKWDVNSSELQQLAADVRARGIDQPLIVTITQDSEETPGSYYLVDGRHRFLAAQAAGLVEVPVIVRDESEAREIVLHSLVERRHYTKGALAYLSFPIISGKHCGNGGDRKSASIESTLIGSAEDLARQLGFSRDLYFQAREVHKRFAADPEAKEYFEPQILSGEMGLGAVIAGIAGRDATINKRKTERDYDQLLFEGFDSLTKRITGYWSKLDDARRREVQDWAVRSVLEFPAELRGAIAQAIRTAAKEAR